MYRTAVCWMTECADENRFLPITALTQSNSNLRSSLYGGRSQEDADNDSSIMMATFPLYG